MGNNGLIKYSGQVYTPDFIVDIMLDFCEYNSKNILKKHLIDNSCGDGAFLCAAALRYCKIFFQSYSDKEILKNELQTYIHGIEIDEIAYKNCLYNLNETVKQYKIKNVQWDIINADALKISKFDYKIDYVVGNPPYVRVHNLKNNYNTVKSFYFANGGMTDLYLVFFELGFRMMNSKGKLCYITPSSWLNSLAANNLRSYILKTYKMAGLIDLEHYQAFENATTYSIICLFDNAQLKDTFDYNIYDEIKKNKIFIDTLSYKDITIGQDFYISTKEELRKLKKIKLFSYPKYCVVKNGFATLADKVFIGNIPFDKFTIPIIKASTGKWYKGFFPYDKFGKPLPQKIIFENKSIADYLNRNKKELLKDLPEEQNQDWYLYGRTQALKDVYRDKIAINTIIKDLDSIKLNFIPKGCGVYSGLYILSVVPFEIIISLIKSQDFIEYIKILKNYKSGGYYTFNSKDLEQFLNFKLSKYATPENNIPLKKCGVSQGSFQFV